MSSGPLVSIITPSFNQAAYLEDTIRSVLAQDYSPIEYLIVDGASSDGSLAIIQEYASLSPGRLTWWVSEPDAGQAEALNKGLRHARGDIIAWLNSDDIYLPGAVRQAVAALEADPDLGMVFGDAISIDAEGKPLNRLIFGNWGLAELVAFRIICQPAVFMRRAALEKAGYLDASYHFMLDHHLWLRIACQAPILYAGNVPTSTPWAAARQHAMAKNVAQAEQFSAEILRLFAWLEELPEIAPLMKTHHKRILGGAYRLNARYLLDGGQSQAALRAYGRAVLAWPGYTLKHWHRILYALLLAMRIHKLTTAIDELRGRKSRKQRATLACILREELGGALEQLAHHAPSGRNLFPGTIDDWPGLRLD
jgi:glycosyltransferase involved in cell wall biosynthesis